MVRVRVGVIQCRVEVRVRIMVTGYILASRRNTLVHARARRGNIKFTSASVLLVIEDILPCTISLL